MEGLCTGWAACGTRLPGSPFNLLVPNPLPPHTTPPLLPQEVAGDILREQSPKSLFVVRGKLYELLVNCIPPEVLLRRLAVELMRKLDDDLKHSTAAAAAAYEHRLQEGSKAIFHLEAFVARFMADYKQFVASLM